jgi:hypothetical protein
MLVLCIDLSDKSKPPTNRKITDLNNQSFRSFQSPQSYSGARRGLQATMTQMIPFCTTTNAKNTAPALKAFGSPSSLVVNTTQAPAMTPKHVCSTNMMKDAASDTWRRGGPGEKKPMRSGMRNVCDWIRYPLVPIARRTGLRELLTISPTKRATVKARILLRVL